MLRHLSRATLTRGHTFATGAAATPRIAICGAGVLADEGLEGDVSPALGVVVPEHGVDGASTHLARAGKFLQEMVQVDAFGVNLILGRRKGAERRASAPSARRGGPRSSRRRAAASPSTTCTPSRAARRRCRWSAARASTRAASSSPPPCAATASAMRPTPPRRRRRGLDPAPLHPS